MEKIDEFSYIRYAVISENPENDAKRNILEQTKKKNIDNPIIIGWNFPFVSQEQTNVYHMHRYCVACVLTEEYV